MSLVGNILWLIFGGFLSAMGYVLGGLLLCLTIIGIPFGLQSFRMAGAVLAPFGRVCTCFLSNNPCGNGSQTAWKRKKGEREAGGTGNSVIQYFLPAPQP